MEKTYSWTHTVRLYRETGRLFAVLKALAVAIAITFALVQLLCIRAMSAAFFLSQCKTWGFIFSGMLILALTGYYLWAWAHGGVEEWEYEMDEAGISGRRVVHKAWRMKLFRGLGWVLMLAPGKPGQKMALRKMLYDNSRQTVEISFASVKEVTSDEAKGEIVFRTKGGAKEISVPREDFAAVLAYTSEHISKPRKKNSKKREGTENGR